MWVVGNSYMSTKQEPEPSNQIYDRPNFLMKDEEALLKLSTSSSGLFNSTNMEYYLTESRVIATTSNLSSNQITDISLDQIVSVDEQRDNVLLKYIMGGSFALAGVIALLVNASDLLGVSLILGGLLGIVGAYLNKSTGYVITTPNPDVSMELNVTGNSPKTQKFIDRVRKEARRR